MNYLTRLFILLITLCLSSLIYAESGAFLDDEDEDILPPDKAFQLEVTATANEALEARFLVTPGHYLYKTRIKFEAENGSVEAVSLPSGDMKDDPTFGKTEVFHQDFAAQVRLAAGAGNPLKLKASYQGCSEKGLCYAPIKKTFEIDMPPEANKNKASGALPNIESTPDKATSVLKSGKLWAVIAVFFGVGLLLSLTPCVWPMIPILSSIIVGGKHEGRLHTFNLSLAYVLGVAFTNTLAGIAAAYSGQLVSNTLQTPLALSFGALVFVILALSMFGLYELQLPSALEGRVINVTNRIKGGRFLGVFLMGILSALIVSPCVAAPLATALLYIAQTGDVVLGGSALFSMSIGMGVPLLMIGASAGSLLPKTGPWMNAVRNFFGVVMLGMAVWILGPVIPKALQMLLWAALLIVPAIFMHALDPLPQHTHAWAKLWKGVAIIMLLYGIAILVGAASGAKSPLQPLSQFSLNQPAKQANTSHLNFVRVKNVSELDAQIKTAAGKKVMLDFYADWCVACVEMENDTFSQVSVQQALQGMLLLQADVTGNTEEDTALLKRFGLFGPPGIIFFNEQGQEIPHKVIGFQTPDEFLATINKL